MFTAITIAYVTGRYGEGPIVSWAALAVDFFAWMAVVEIAGAI